MHVLSKQRKHKLISDTDKLLVRLKRGQFSSPSVQTRRHAISALEACILLTQTKQASRAAEAWQACAMTPQMLVRNTVSGEAFWTVATANYAVVVWKAEELDPQLFALGLELPWDFMLVLNVRDWEWLPHRWQTCARDPAKYGFAALSVQGPTARCTLVTCQRQLPVWFSISLVMLL